MRQLDTSFVQESLENITRFELCKASFWRKFAISLLHRALQSLVDLMETSGICLFALACSRRRDHLCWQKGEMQTTRRVRGNCRCSAS